VWPLVLVVARGRRNHSGAIGRPATEPPNRTGRTVMPT
jgi:hypothetical protein